MTKPNVIVITAHSTTETAIEAIVGAQQVEHRAPQLL